jgi:tripartite-type tricarboxylate transporter receptor subunit TctC
MIRLNVVVALLALVAAVPIASEAQEWPNRPIKFVVPYPPGGSTDVGARVIGDHLSRVLGQQIVVENKSGGSGNIGFEAAAKSAPDGYTVLIAPDQVVSAPHVFKVGFDPLKDLVPIIQLSRQPVVLAVHPSLGVNSLAELVAMAKARPGMSFATSGVGSQQHFVAEWFTKIAGIKLEHVPYRGGGQAINDLIAGHVKIASLGSSPLIPHYKAGTVRLLAQSTQARSPSLLDVPTYQEAGITGLALDQWLGVLVPAGTPRAIVARLNAEIGNALTVAAIRESFLQSAQEPVGGDADAFSRLVRDDFAKYERLVRELNIKAN